MYGYIYLTVDTLKNHVYVGQKQSSRYIPSYYGSGTRIKPIINKRKHTLKNYILEWCETREELNNAEIDWIKNFREECGEKCLNITDGGTQPPKLIGKDNPNFGKPLSEERKRKLSIFRTGTHQSEETKKKISLKTRGENNPMYGKSAMKGKHHTDETKKKMSNSAKGKTGTWMKGRKFTEEHKRKISEYRKTLCREKNSAFDRKWITNGIEVKFIKKEELEFYLKNNWRLGRK